MKNRFLTFAEAINEAIYQSMESDKKILLMGEGVGDPKEVFGTTKNLYKSFKNRVFDMPLSELAATGLVIGASLNGYKGILVHQRVDFSLLSMDQIINVAAKLHYISNGQHKVPIVIRMIVGRGWGQSAQHSQSLESLFSHIPGLKVIIPSNAYEAKGMMISSIKDSNPTIFIEHRWLHNTMAKVPLKKYEVKLESCNLVSKGNDITIVSSSLLLSYAIKAKEFLKNYGISLEVINLKVTKPLNIKKIIKSVIKSKRILVLDPGMTEYGISSEIISRIVENNLINLKNKPQRLGTKNYPTPVSKALIKNYYPSIIDIIELIVKMLNPKLFENNIFKKNLKNLKNKVNKKIDVPYEGFKGPF